MLKSLKNTSVDQVLNYFNKNIANKEIYMDPVAAPYMTFAVDAIFEALDVASQPGVERPECVLLYGPGGYAKTYVVSKIFKAINVCNLLPVLGKKELISDFEYYLKVQNKYNKTYSYYADKMLEEKRFVDPSSELTQEDCITCNNIALSILSPEELQHLNKMSEMKDLEEKLQLYLENTSDTFIRSFGKSTTEMSLLGGPDFGAMARSHNKVLRANFENSMFSHELVVGEELFDVYTLDILKDMLQSGRWTQEGIEIPITTKLLVACSNVKPNILKKDISKAALLDRFRKSVQMKGDLTYEFLKGMLDVEFSEYANSYNVVLSRIFSYDNKEISLTLNPRTVANLAFYFYKNLDKKANSNEKAFTKTVTTCGIDISIDDAAKMISMFKQYEPSIQTIMEAEEILKESEEVKKNVNKLSKLSDKISSTVYISDDIVSNLDNVNKATRDSEIKKASDVISKSILSGKKLILDFEVIYDGNEFVQNIESLTVKSEVSAELQIQDVTALEALKFLRMYYKTLHEACKTASAGFLDKSVSRSSFIKAVRVSFKSFIRAYHKVESITLDRYRLNTRLKAGKSQDFTVHNPNSTVVFCNFNFDNFSLDFVASQASKGIPAADVLRFPKYDPSEFDLVAEFKSISAIKRVNNKFMDNLKVLNNFKEESVARGFIGTISRLLNSGNMDSESLIYKNRTKTYPKEFATWQDKHYDNFIKELSIILDGYSDRVEKLFDFMESEISELDKSLLGITTSFSFMKELNDEADTARISKIKLIPDTFKKISELKVLAEGIGKNRTLDNESAGIKVGIISTLDQNETSLTEISKNLEHSLDTASKLIKILNNAKK